MVVGGGGFTQSEKHLGRVRVRLFVVYHLCVGSTKQCGRYKNKNCILMLQT